MKAARGRWPAWSLLVCFGCSGGGSGSATPTPAAHGRTSEITEARAMLDAGRADDALARLEQSQSPEALTLRGDAWAKKAESAPLPTPEALAPDAPKGTVPVTPEFKREELQAIDFYEKAIAARPEDPLPRLGLARLLAPHAQRRFDQARAAAAAPAGKPVRGRVPTPPPAAAPGPDFSPARVAQLMHAAAEKTQGIEPIEALYEFATRTEQVAEADWALRERIRRENENPDHLLRYGDFLRQVKKEPDAAIEQYRQALIWKADDPAAKARIADIYIDMGNAHYANGENALADARYQDAAKWVPDKTGEQWQRLQREMEKLRRLRR